MERPIYMGIRDAQSLLRVGHVTFTNGGGDGNDRLESSKKQADGETFWCLDEVSFLETKARLSTPEISMKLPPGIF